MNLMRNTQEECLAPWPHLLFDKHCEVELGSISILLYWSVALDRVVILNARSHSFHSVALDFEVARLRVCQQVLVLLVVV